MNGLILWLLNVAPGWDWIPFLTDEFAGIVWLINLSLMMGLVVNLVYLGSDPTWVRGLGDAITAAVGCGVLFRLVTVFPFDLTGRWSWVAGPFRLVLALACFGTAVAVIANLAGAARSAQARGAGPLPL
jgi:hypothetical protein